MMLLVAVIYEYSERCTIQIFQNIKKKLFTVLFGELMGKTVKKHVFQDIVWYQFDDFFFYAKKSFAVVNIRFYEC